MVIALLDVGRLMVDDAPFCRFSRDPALTIAIREIPDDGFCLSAFVVLTPSGSADEVLLGRPDPSAPWDRIGALAPKQVEAIKDRWMLPSRHLRLGESPEEAARRIAAEQLGLTTVSLRGPEVFSEVYPSSSRPQFTRHWDLDFVFRGELPRNPIPRSAPFAELNWQNADGTPATQFARGHQDILRLAGLRRRDP